MSRTGNSCESCHVGRLHVYATKTGREYITRYLRCRVCGARPAENKLVVPLAMARRIIGERKKYNFPSVVQTSSARPIPTLNSGYNRDIMNEPNYDSDHNPLVCLKTVCARLRVKEHEYRLAELRGEAPSASPFNGLYSWPGIVSWLEDNCPVADAELHGEYIDSLNKAEVANAD